MSEKTNVFKFTITVYVAETNNVLASQIFDCLPPAVSDAVEGSVRFGNKKGTVTKVDIYKEQVFRKDMNRSEYLEWAKYRALEILEKESDTGLALDSLISDMLKHLELSKHPALDLTITLRMNGHLKSKQAAKHHIEGFN